MNIIFMVKNLKQKKIKSFKINKKIKYIYVLKAKSNKKII